MSKLKSLFIAALGLVSLNAQAQTHAMELVNKPITQLECGQDVDVHGPYSVVASKFGYNTGGAIQLFYNDQFVRNYKHDSYQNNNDLGKPETVAIGEHAIVIGAPLYKNTNNGKIVGRVEVFPKTTNGSHYATYASQAFSEGSTDVLTDFGRAVDIDGNWIAVGAPKKGNDGGVKVFQRSSGMWVHIGWLPLPNFNNAPDRYPFPGSTVANPANFGSDVAIKNNKLIVGAPGVGSFYIYEYNGTSWVLTGEYSGPKVPYLGGDVTISDNHALASSGNSVVVYQKHWNGTWINLQTINSHQSFIDDIAVENNHLVIGKAGASQNNGVVEYYELRNHAVNGVWVYDFVMIGKMHVDVNASTKGLVNHKRLGYSVAIQGDVVVAGAHNAMYTSVADGAAFRAPFHHMMPVQAPLRASDFAFTSESVLSLYPNPAADVINISTERTIRTVTATNTVGVAKDLAVEGNQINVSELPSGLYIITVNTEEGVITEKVQIK
ncbi:MAG: T9SS type A sorting domain-containing protein [Sporocytophaga sp.]|nr:T9SS type A sorting domain-containing protein [Sporocytophaga sp.]